MMPRLAASLAMLLLRAQACPSDPAGLQKALDTLKAGGYEIDEGAVFFDTSVTGFGANPASPYGLYVFDDAPSASGGLPELRIGGQDAFIFHGCTPPPVSYFSFRSYVFSQPGRLLNPFAALGDSLNHLELAAQPAGSVFDALTTVATTGDQQTFADVQQAFDAAGLGDTVNPPDAVPANWAHFGQSDTGVDSFVMLVRVAVPAPGMEQLYKDYIAKNQTVYRLRRPDSATPRKPFPVVPDKSREGPVSEESLAEVLATLEAAVLSQKQSAGLKLVDTQRLTASNLDSEACIVKHLMCLGNNNDALYSASRSFQLKDSDRLFLVGVHHPTVNTAVYSNFALYDKITSLDLTINSFHFNGTAARYVTPSQVPQVAQLFVLEISRSCAGEADACLEVDSEHAPEGQAITIRGRAYLNPATKTGPAPDQILLPTLLHMTA